MDNYYEGLTSYEIAYIEEAKKTGKKYGNCDELSALCKKAYADYKNKIISEKAYSKMYATCYDYAYPH